MNWYYAYFSRIQDAELFIESPIFQSLKFLSDLTFTHEGNKTYFDGLVNFEKMVCTYVFIKIKDVTLFLITRGFYIIWLLNGKIRHTGKQKKDIHMFMIV